MLTRMRWFVHTIVRYLICRGIAGSMSYAEVYFGTYNFFCALKYFLFAEAKIFLAFGPPGSRRNCKNWRTSSTAERPRSKGMRLMPFIKFEAGIESSTGKEARSNSVTSNMMVPAFAVEAYIRRSFIGEEMDITYNQTITKYPGIQRDCYWASHPCCRKRSWWNWNFITWMLIFRLSTTLSLQWNAPSRILLMRQNYAWCANPSLW